MDAANAKVRASESEVASLRKATEALQQDLDACRREAAQLRAPAQVCTYGCQDFFLGQLSAQARCSELH